MKRLLDSVNFWLIVVAVVMVICIGLSVWQWEWLRSGAGMGTQESNATTIQQSWIRNWWRDCPGVRYLARHRRSESV